MDERQHGARPSVAAGVIFTDERSRVLMVRPTYKDYWDIPGGQVEPGESPRAAAIREVNEELGLRITVGPLLAVDWAPTESDGDKLLFLFSAAELPPNTEFRFTDGEIRETRYVPLAEVHRYTIGRLSRRLRSALLDSRPHYLEHGLPLD